MAGGLLVTPRPSQALAEDPAPTAASPSPAAPASTTAPEDLTPRADNGDEAAGDQASPVPEAPDLGLPRELSLAELFPAEAALGAVSPDMLQNDAIAIGQGGAVGPDSNPISAMPLVAGIVVTLAILFGGGGLLWWRNRDTAYWPA